jgi:hypothetical protein
MWRQVEAERVTFHTDRGLPPTPRTRSPHCPGRSASASRWAGSGGSTTPPPRRSSPACSGRSSHATSSRTPAKRGPSSRTGATASTNRDPPTQRDRHAELSPVTLRKHRAPNRTPHKTALHDSHSCHARGREPNSGITTSHMQHRLSLLVGVGFEERSGPPCPRCLVISAPMRWGPRFGFPQVSPASVQSRRTSVWSFSMSIARLLRVERPTVPADHAASGGVTTNVMSRPVDMDSST